MFGLLACMFLTFGLRSVAADGEELAGEVMRNETLTAVVKRADDLLASGLTAGSGYGEVWIRDLNTFIEPALGVVDSKVLREALLRFFAFQGVEGDIVDGYIPREKANVGYKYRESDLASGYLAHKNTVETDQEASLIQAVRKYVGVTGDAAFLQERVEGKRVVDRLEWALDYVHRHRFDADHGLVWGATTVDWGDVQPEHEWGVELDDSSHRALDIYDNAMFLIAIRDYISMVPGGSVEAGKWRRVAEAVHASVRKHLWDGERQKFRPHIYLEGSPFPAGFVEDEVHYHGGTAVAIEAGLLSDAEVRVVLGQMRENVGKAGASSIGLTVYPVYPAGTFKNRGMGPYSYQNGGDWCWFGGRMIQQLIRLGMVEDAYRELLPMVERVERHGGFYEWWTPDNQPRGSGQFRGSAGVLSVAVRQLRDWAAGVVAGAKAE
jgi:glycogen debranching enzyme